MNNLISNYISSLDINSVNSLLINNNIYLDNNELSNIYYIIKNNYNDLINNKLYLYKDKFNMDNYNKLNNLLNQYIKKYLG